MACVYIDFECFNKQLIEMSAILVCNQQLVSSFHQFLNDPKLSNTRGYYLHAQHSHCIEINVLYRYGSSTEDEVKTKFFKWLTSFNYKKIVIAGNGDDVSCSALHAWLPELRYLPHLDYKQVRLPPWRERQYGIYHISTFTMKRFCQLFSCSAQNHSLPYKHSKDVAGNVSKMARYNYGFHCSFFDCFELAFFEMTLPSYVCDKEFQRIVHDDYAKTAVTCQK